jgi:hypothetical protein
MHVQVIYRPSDCYNKPAQPAKQGKKASPATRGLFNVSRTTFYDVIEPRLERVALTDKAIGYTGRSVERVQREMIAAARP